MIEDDEAKLQKTRKYDFRCPLLIYEKKLESLQPDLWKSGDIFIKALSTRTGIQGIVVPLELKADKVSRMSLLGVDLVNWLRWSGADSVRFLPLLAASWQSIAQILRKRPNLLLIAEGSRYFRLPEAGENGGQALDDFVNAVRTGQAKACNEKVLEKYASGGSEDVARLTHHDLANDFYAAYRLWVGYLCALRDDLDRIGSKDKKLIEAEIDRAQKATATLECVREVKVKRDLPWFNQYQTFAKARELPKYPDPKFPPVRFARHIRDGLPPKARILFVDDEFDKGMAEVLLQISCRKDSFPPADSQGKYGEERKAHAYKNELDKERAEWVYRDETERVRFVCVKDTIAARNWLYLWGDLEFPPVPGEEEKRKGKFEEAKTRRAEAENALNSWRQGWENARGQKRPIVPVNPQRPLTPVELARQTFVELGLHHDEQDRKIAHRKLKTLVLLDLRLTKRSAEEEDRSYDPSELSSVVLRKQIYEGNRDLPVIIFTASRNAINVSAMADTGRIDGWIWKEAPDVPEDENYSKRVAHSLLGRIYKHSAAPPGYRDSLGWDADRRFRDFKVLLSQEFSDDERRAEISKIISEESNKLFGDIKSGVFDKQFKAEKKKHRELKFWGFIQGLVGHEKVIQWLVARRVGVAVYFYTGSPKGNRWERDLARLSATIGVQPPGGKDKNNTSKVIAFQRDLALSYKEGEILLQLLPDEIEWLMEQKWDNQKQALLQSARKEILRQCKSEGAS